MNVLKKFLQDIIYVLLIPFHIIIGIVEGIKNIIIPSIYELYERFLKTLMKVLELIFILPEMIYKRLKQDFYKRDIRKQSENYKQELMNICLGHNYSFNSKINHIFILLSTTGLQFISFFTTFAGTSYYFGNITKPKFLGPFIITSVIQFSILFLSNKFVNREIVNKSKKIMLAFFLFVSIMFSYAGMIHTMITPHKQMKANYEEFISKYNEIYQIYISNFNQDEDVLSYVDTKVNELQLILKNKINTAQIQLNSTNKYSSTSNSNSTTTNNEGETSSTHSSSTTINNEWTKLNNEVKTLQSLQKQLSNDYKTIPDSISKALALSDENSVLEALKAIEKVMIS